MTAQNRVPESGTARIRGGVLASRHRDAEETDLSVFLKEIDPIRVAVDVLSETITTEREA